MALLKVWVGQRWVRDFVASLSSIEGLQTVHVGEEHVFFDVPEEAVEGAHQRLRKAGVHAVVETAPGAP